MQPLLSLTNPLGQNSLEEECEAVVFPTNLKSKDLAFFKNIATGSENKRASRASFSTELPLGIILDFSRKLRRKIDRNKKNLASFLTEAMVHGNETKQADVSHVAISLVRREVLYAEVLASISIFWKREKNPDWCHPCLEVCKAKFKSIVACVRAVKMLSLEVDEWISRHASANLISMREPEETLNDRRERMCQFWEDYHTNFRKIESLALVRRTPVWRKTPPVVSPNTSPRADGRRPQAKACPTHVPSLNSLLVTSPGLKPKNLEITTALESDDEEEDELTPTWALRHSSPKARMLGRCMSLKDLRKKRQLQEKQSLLSGCCWPEQGGRIGRLEKAKKVLRHRAQPECIAKVRRKLVQNPVSFPKMWNQPPSPGVASMTPTRDYLWECENSGILPTALPFITGHSFKLNAWDKTVVDNDLLQMAAAISADSQIEEVDLEGNTILTDLSLMPILNKLFDDVPSISLTRLSLNSCRQAGQGTCMTLVRLLADTRGAVNLTFLDLSCIDFAAHLQRSLCEAVQQHPKLKTVYLAKVGFGMKSVSCRKNVGMLLSSATIEELDIGWNCFSMQEFEHIAECMVAAQKLKYLSMANCSSTKSTSDAPCLYFLEWLSRDCTLTELDVSLNQIGFNGALVLEAALGLNRSLQKINISQNPLGVLGMRSFLRLLSQDSGGLMEFEFDGVASGLSMEIGYFSKQQLFNATTPGGRYHLNLERPYHRAILKMLYRVCVRFGVSPKDAFEDLDFSKGRYTHPDRDVHGNWDIPHQGKLSISFSIEKGMETALKGMEDKPFGDVISRHYDLMRVKPSFRKVVPMLAHWRRMSGHQNEQLCMLDALSMDFCLTYEQLAILCSDVSMSHEAIDRLLQCIGDPSSRHLVFMMSQSMQKLVKVILNCSQLLGFNLENPTAHYKLRLDNCSDHAVAERLLLLDRWESNLCRRAGIPAVSQKGDYTRIRNEMINGRAIYDVKSISDWILPLSGEFEFDYVSAKRPIDLVPIDGETFDKILLSLHHSECVDEQKVWVIRTVAHHVGITSLQLRELMGAFHDDHMRAELFVCFVFRVVDPWNEKVFRVRFAGRPDLMKQLRQRLGETTLFPFIQPEHTDFSFNLSVNDERLAATLLIYIAAREGDNFKNIRNPKYVKADGNRDRQFDTTGVSRSWEDYNRIYDSGVFSCHYVCSPNDLNWDLRKRLFEHYGRWKVTTDREDVKWWAALPEAPPDVLEFLEFLVGGFDDMGEAFRCINGSSANGLTLREFEISMVKALGCHKFDGPDQKQRVANIFRYLDPSGEGEVSVEEWGALQYLWLEMQQSIREFVQFLERVYGNDPAVNFLDAAWDAFDDDGSGEIDKKEWVDKALLDLKYFGPSEVIFSFLDKDDEGTISWDEFAGLHRFRREDDPNMGEGDTVRRGAVIGRTRSLDG